MKLRALKFVVNLGHVDETAYDVQTARIASQVTVHLQIEDHRLARFLTLTSTSVL